MKELVLGAELETIGGGIAQLKYALSDPSPFIGGSSFGATPSQSVRSIIQLYQITPEVLKSEEVWPRVKNYLFRLIRDQDLDELDSVLGFCGLNESQRINVIKDGIYSIFTYYRGCAVQYLNNLLDRYQIVLDARLKEAIANSAMAEPIWTPTELKELCNLLGLDEAETLRILKAHIITQTRQSRCSNDRFRDIANVFNLKPEKLPTEARVAFVRHMKEIGADTVPQIATTEDEKLAIDAMKKEVKKRFDSSF